MPTATATPPAATLAANIARITGRLDWILVGDQPDRPGHLAVGETTHSDRTPVFSIAPGFVAEFVQHAGRGRDAWADITGDWFNICARLGLDASIDWFEESDERQVMTGTVEVPWCSTCLTRRVRYETACVLCGAINSMTDITTPLAPF